MPLSGVSTLHRGRECRQCGFLRLQRAVHQGRSERACQHGHEWKSDLSRFLSGMWITYLGQSRPDPCYPRHQRGQPGRPEPARIGGRYLDGECPAVGRAVCHPPAVYDHANRGRTPRSRLPLAHCSTGACSPRLGRGSAYTWLETHPSGSRLDGMFRTSGSAAPTRRYGSRQSDRRRGIHRDALAGHLYLRWACLLASESQQPPKLQRGG